MWTGRFAFLLLHKIVLNFCQTIAEEATVIKVLGITFIGEDPHGFITCDFDGLVTGAGVLSMFPGSLQLEAFRDRFQRDSVQRNPISWSR